MKDIYFVMWLIPPTLKFCFMLDSLNDFSSEISTPFMWRILSTPIYWTLHIHRQI